MYFIEILHDRRPKSSESWSRKGKLQIQFLRVWEDVYTGTL